MTYRLNKMAERIQSAHNLPELPTREQLLAVLGEQALGGHVPAIRLMLEEMRRDADSDEGTISEFDELAERRAA